MQLPRTKRCSQHRSRISLCGGEIVSDISTETSTRNTGARSLNCVLRIWKTWMAALVSFCSIGDLILKKNPLRLTPGAPKRSVPTYMGYIVARTGWRTCIHRGTLKRRKKERTHDKYIKRNIRLSTDLATRISFPALQGTLEKEKKYYQ